MELFIFDSVIHDMLLEDEVTLKQYEIYYDSRKNKDKSNDYKDLYACIKKDFVKFHLSKHSIDIAVFILD